MARARAPRMALGVALGLACASIAWGQTDQDRKALIDKVNPSVVKVVTESGLGSGYVVDASGIIATNCHVIKHAKHVFVAFPADHDKRHYVSEGYLEVLPTKDLCLLRVNVGPKHLTALKIADSLPRRAKQFIRSAPRWDLTTPLPAGWSLQSVPARKSTTLSRGWEARTFTRRRWVMTWTPLDSNVGADLAGQQRRPVDQCPRRSPRAQHLDGPAGQNLNFAISALHLQEVDCRCKQAG